MVNVVDNSTLGIWALSVDSLSNIRESRLGLVLRSPKGVVVEQAINCEFKTINNEVEYETLIAGLNLAKSLRVKRIKVSRDPQLIVRQFQGSYETRDPKMAAYLDIT
ncbi:hypothetical protein LWI28_009463 [Acer negundo]|uniref:RNase H type-1 domain-containing protein n=1 Tax=Acer negundo TaxID=4023 RepID=A0AAD5NU72_ACENE|nr:hypothetical protein LWI28_009463 [Acer negundo]